MSLRAITLDGVRIAYRFAGEGPVLLLVHGIAGSSMTWQHVMPALAQRFTVLAPDLLEIFDGVGHYPHCEAPERFVEVLLDFIATTEPARPPPRSPGPGRTTPGGVDEALAPD